MNTVLKVAAVAAVLAGSVTAWFVSVDQVEAPTVSWQRRAADRAQVVQRWERFEFSCLSALPNRRWAGAVVKGSRLQTLQAPPDAALSVVVVVRSVDERDLVVDLEVTNFQGGPALCAGRAVLARDQQADEREALRHGIDALLAR